MEWFTSTTGAIELQITIEQARSVTHPGDCEADVRALSNVTAIKAQTDKITPETLVKVLDDYGTWDEEQLKDHDQNIQRLLWLAGGDIADNYKTEAEKIKDAYVDEVCPDCQDPIPDDVVEGGECTNCGHVFNSQNNENSL